MDSDDQDDNCVICCRETTIYATGRCNHRVCYQCSTRMRVLCETNECPICRANMSVVIFTHEPQVFTTLSSQYRLRDRRYNIAFEDEDIREQFELLLENRCKVCSEAFHTFDKFKEHMRRRHELHFCDLCVNNLKIFTFERKCYSRKDLARHRRVGDPDETSLRGHPLCEFCDQRYVDDDDLFRHLRRDHYFCHFCDADSLSPFYKDYEALRVHFRKDHYLCEEGDCAREKFVGAFRTEIDLKAHIASYHAKNKSKAEIKQARTLEVGFTYNYRNNPSGNSGSRQSDFRGGRFGQHRKRNIEDNSLRDGNDMYAINNQDEAFNTQSTQEFPYLSDDVQEDSRTVPQNTFIPSSNINSFSVQSYSRNSNSRRNIMSSEDFPALSSTTFEVTSEGYNTQGSKLNFSVNQQNANASQHSSNVSIQLSRKNGPTSNSTVVQMNGIGNSRKKAPRFPEFQVENADEKNTTPSANPKWITKKQAAPSFDEDFPKLAVKEDANSDFGTLAAVAETKVGLDAFSDTDASTAATYSGVVVEQSEGSGGPFVTIKCRSKKKKQNRVDANKTKQEEKNSKPESSLKPFSSYVNRSANKLDNQENKDPVLNIVTTVTLPNPVEESYWEKKVCFVNDDFPPLEAPELPKKPPGFDARIRTPPPGFGAKVISGPTAPITISLSSIARQIAVPNGKSDKTKSAYTHLSSNGTYGKPPDFDKRNDHLIERIRELSNTSKFSEFKTLSGNFRQGRISAEQYHTKCLDVLGEHAFLEIYPELVSLLPDINKQLELFAIHNMFLKQRSATGAVSKKFLDADYFNVCESCNQVLTQIDYASHQFVYHGVSKIIKKK